MTCCAIRGATAFENTKVRRPGAVRRRSDAVCTERIAHSETTSRKVGLSAKCHRHGQPNAVVNRGNPPAPRPRLPPRPTASPAPCHTISGLFYLGTSAGAGPSQADFPAPGLSDSSRHAGASDVLPAFGFPGPGGLLPPGRSASLSGSRGFSRGSLVRASPKPIPSGPATLGSSRW